MLKSAQDCSRLFKIVQDFSRFLLEEDNFHPMKENDICYIVKSSDFLLKKTASLLSDHYLAISCNKKKEGLSLF